MQKLLTIIISLLFIVGCEDKKEDPGLRGKVIISDYFTYSGEVNIEYSIVNTGSEDIYGWIVSFTAVMDNGIQYIFDDSVQKSRGYDPYSGAYFEGYVTGDTSQKYIASTPTPYAGVSNASVNSAIFKTREESFLTVQQIAFANDHWTLKDWVENTQLNPISGLVPYSDFKIDGAHSLTLELSGSLADEFGYFVSSDSLVNHPDWIYSDDVILITDDNFYSYIGLYNQFVGGWDDIEQWYIVENTINDTITITLMTPNKSSYLDM